MKTLMRKRLLLIGCSLVVLLAVLVWAEVGYAQRGGRGGGGGFRGGGGGSFQGGSFSHGDFGGARGGGQAGFSTRYNSASFSRENIGGYGDYNRYPGSRTYYPNRNDYNTTIVTRNNYNRYGYVASPEHIHGGNYYPNTGYVYHDGYSGGYYDNTGAFIAGLAIGAIVTSLPTGCVIYGGYYQCGNVYYQPIYQGTQIVYQVVSGP